MGDKTFLVVCVTDGDWYDLESATKTVGPKKNEVCEVLSTYVFKGERYYHLKDWCDPADPFDGYSANNFVPLQQKTVYVSVPETIKEQTEELILS